MEKIILMFSRGKDSIVAYLKLIEKGYDVIPIFYYVIPDLAFVNESISYYEKIFNKKIEIIPCGRYWNYIKCACWNDQKSIDYIDKLSIYDITTDMYNEYLRNKYNVEKMAIGIKRYDSLQRMYMKSEKEGFLYPILELKDKDVYNELKNNNIKLSIDYAIWGCSFDGYTAKWMIPLKRYLPDDYQKVKTYFPLIDVEIKRYEKIKDKLPKYEIKRKARINKFQDLIIKHINYEPVY